MEQFFLWSLIISIFLTLALNLLSIISPKMTAHIQSRFASVLISSHHDENDADGSLMQSIMPIELILIASLFLTIAVNIGVILVI